MIRLVASVLVVAAACGPAATTGPAPSAPASPTHHPASATPTPINVDDMMGGSISAATVFAQARDEIVAVKLQNHFLPYRVAVGESPHVSVAPDGSRVYVADRSGGRTRIRALDPATGVEMTATDLDRPLAAGKALAQDRADRLLLLLEACPTCAWGSGMVVEAVSTSPLADRGGVYKAPCGDRLLASSGRIAVVCSSASSISIGKVGAAGIEGPEGGGLVAVPDGPIVASAMLSDGTIVVATAKGIVHRIPSASTALVRVVELDPGSVVPDGVAALGSDRFVVATTASGESRATAYVGSTGQLVAGPHPLRMPPTAVVGLWPYVYFGGDRGLYHVDLQSGLLERMVELDRPVPLAVAAR